MTEPVALALIASLPALLAAMTAAVLAYQGLAKVRQTHDLVNSMATTKDALVHDAALKEGELVGRDFAEHNKST